jgi:glucose-1-phosphatase
MIKTVYFDIGNVLLFFSHEKMFTQLAQCVSLPEPDVRKLILETPNREDYEKGKIKTEDLYRQFRTRSSRAFSIEDFHDALSDIFTPNLELWPVVEALKKQNIRLILLSNTCEGHFRYATSRYPIFKFFDHSILSYEVGAWKPEALIFEKALQEARCKPEECFYTDDIPEFIASAQRVGLPGAVYTDVTNLKKELNLLGIFF